MDKNLSAYVAVRLPRQEKIWEFKFETCAAIGITEGENDEIMLTLVAPKDKVTVQDTF